MKTSLMLFLFLSNICLAETQVFEGDNEALQIKNEQGDVTITGTNDKKLTVDYTKGVWDKNCELNITKKDNTIVLEVKHKGLLKFNDKCQASFKISTPRKMDTDLKLGSGNISVDGIFGSLAVKLGNGNVNVDNSTLKKLSAETGNGNMNIKGELAEVMLKAGNGKIDATYEAVLEKSKFSAELGHGDIAIRVPQNLSAKVDFKSGMGIINNKLKNAENPDIMVNVKAGKGNLTIESL